MIKDLERGNMLLESIQTLNEAAIHLYEMMLDESDETMEFAQEIRQLIVSMQESFDALYAEENALMGQLINKNALYSLDNLMRYAKTDSKAACHKLQFEFLPLTAELYVDLYFWGFCYPDKDKMWNYYRTEMNELCPLPVPENGEYKYDVSVVIIAYNKLEYTKKCIKYFQEFFPHELNYELILYNNGSNDGTKEFFETLHPNKQIDLLRNTKSWSILSRVAEGKYILTVANDVLILPNAIQNLIKCIESDESICCVMPASPNVANYESIPASYRDEAEMIEFAQKNNVADSSRWEQRARLNPPLLLARSDSSAVHTLCTYHYPFMPDRFLAFTDDAMSLVARRSKQKCILAKDAYIHHFGSVTVSDVFYNARNDMSEFYSKGRNGFLRIFDIDPWSVGFCYDAELVFSLMYDLKQPTNILGVNCGMGDTMLKIKAMLGSCCHNTNVGLYNITDNLSYKDDLAGLSDNFAFIAEWEQVENTFNGVKFSYIVIEDVTEGAASEKTLKMLFAKLIAGGVMAVKHPNTVFVDDRCNKTDKTEHWRKFYKS